MVNIFIQESISIEISTTYCIINHINANRHSRSVQDLSRGRMRNVVSRVELEVDSPRVVELTALLHLSTQDTVFEEAILAPRQHLRRLEGTV